MLLHHCFIKTAKRFSDKLAFIDRTTDKKITYSRALIASLILSNKFSKYDEGLMGVMIPTSAGCALSMLGALMSGRTPVMINYSTGAAENARYAQSKCGFKTIITSKALLEKINCPHVDGMVYIEDVMKGVSVMDKIAAAIKSKMPENMILNSVHQGDLDDNLIILFTSGSEKEPKAVQLTHKNVHSNIENFSEVISLSHEDRFLANLPLFHVFGQTVTLWAPVYHGATIITYSNPLDYKTVCNIVREEKPTIMAGTPSFFRGYLIKSEPGDFKSVRFAVSGADKCPDVLRKGYLEKHNMTLFEGYGVTETSPVISTNLPEYNRPGSTGKAIPGVQVKIEHLETGKACKTGEVGRIMIKGDLVMKGYLNDIEETSLRIRDGWYDTGDMGYLDEDGYLWHSGRLKRFVKVGGEMVSLVAVENVLERLLPEDISCCIVDIPDSVKGAKIVAAVTRKIDEPDTIKRMSEHLPPIALPKHFVFMEDLPKMGSGKTDFRKTSEMVSAMLGANQPHLS